MARVTWLLFAFLGMATSSVHLQQPATPVTMVNDARGLGIRWARIPAGTFQMGCVPGDNECDDDEKPRHAVTLTQDYWLMTTEVTIEMFRAYATEGHGMPLQPEWNTSGRQPIVLVDRAASSEFCGWLHGRLPTEAEWERAARGGIEGEKYPWGNDLLTRIAGKMPANIADAALRRKLPYEALKDGGYDDGYARAAAVGSFPANRFGLHDVIGNVAEWVADDYSAPFGDGPAVNPRASSGIGTQVRGGSWNRAAKMARSSFRLHDIGAAPTDSRDWDIGIRCAKDVTR